MFPLEFPSRIIRDYGRSGEWILDPFCGRGTTNYAARLFGLPSIGIDSNPVAAALGMAKFREASPKSVIQTAQRILSGKTEVHSVPSGEFWEWAYHTDTLLALCKLRESLQRRCDSEPRKVLRAIIMGALHGGLTRTVPSYFSNQAPRTFAPKPEYSVRFWKERKLKPPFVDVLGVIERRAHRFLSNQTKSVEGWIICGDARSPAIFPDGKQFSLIITSPPYYGMRTYVPDQWLRYWFVGGPSYVVYGQPDSDLEHKSPDDFAKQLGQVWQNVRTVSKSDARMVIRFGGIQDRKQDPMELLKKSLRAGGWKLITARSAGNAHQGKRQAQQFGVQSSPRQEWDAYARPS